MELNELQKNQNENENDIMLKIMIGKFHVDNRTFFHACTKVLYTRKKDLLGGLSNNQRLCTE
jgi:hypothetical protein